MTPDTIALATYDAMCRLPPFAVLANSLLAADTKAQRDALLKTATPKVRDAAMAYLAGPEPIRERTRRQEWMRQDPRRVAALRTYYAGHIADFVNDWGVTIDPRSIAKGRAALVPFHLWPKQVELVNWMLERWRNGEPGTVVKSRDVGASWVAMALLCSLGIFERNFAAGVASATEAKLDRSSDPDTLFAKAEEFMRHIPPEFNGGYEESKHRLYMRMQWPETGASLTGEAGEQAGRGGRKSLYIVDESAFFQNPKAIDKALSANTDCRIDMSTVNGLNGFYERAMNPNIQRIDVTWRDDPRKDATWYAKKCAELDAEVVAQEIDCNFHASIAGVVIPSEWVQAAIDIHLKLDLEPTGDRRAALDVGDTGDRNAFAVKQGFLIEHCVTWSGKGSDLYATTSKAFGLCDEHELTEFDYDAAGLGASVRGDAKVLNERRVENGERFIRVSAYNAASPPMRPTVKVPGTDRTWENFALNRKSQAAWNLRLMFRESFKASQGQPYDRERIISISSKIPELNRLIAELSQPVAKETATGKIQIEKAPEGTRSPNMFDSIAMVTAPRVGVVRVKESHLERMGASKDWRGRYRTM